MPGKRSSRSAGRSGARSKSRSGARSPRAGRIKKARRAAGKAAEAAGSSSTLSPRAAASAAANAVATATLNKQSGGGSDTSPQAAAQAAAADIAKSLGVDLSKPGEISAGEARIIAEAAAAATAERLGVKLKQKGKLSRREAMQAVSADASRRRSGQSTPEPTRAEQQSQAEAAAKDQLNKLQNDTAATTNLIERAATTRRDFADLLRSRPELGRREAIEAVTHAILDRLGFPARTQANRREARTAAVRARRRRNTI